MSVAAFIPEIWDANIMVALDKTLVLADPGVTVNTDYEGDISEAGDTVHIGTLVDPVIKNYTPNSTVIVPDQLTINDQTLVIDQSKYFAIGIDDVDKRQALGGGSYLAKAGVRAAVQMSEVIDTYVGTKMVLGAGTTLAPRTIVATSTGADGIYALIIRIKTIMDNLKLPLTGRWIAADPEALNALFFDPRFTASQNYGNANLITNGEIGQIAGFKIKANGNAPIGATAAAGGVSASRFLIASAGSDGFSYAQQIAKTEAYRPESSFSDAIKGLNLYGGKAVRPEFLVVCDVKVTGNA